VTGPIDAAGTWRDLPMDLPPGLPPSRARRQALALGLLGAAVAAVGFGVVAPVVDGLTEREEAEATQRALLARLQRVEAEAPALRRQIAALDAELAAADTLLRAPSASQGVALLQATARTLLQAEGVRPESTQPLPPAPQGSLVRLGLRLEFRAAIEPLHRIFQAIETHRPVLAVRDALISVPGRGGGAPGVALAVRLELLALARVEAASG